MDIAGLLGVCFSHKGYFEPTVTVQSRARPRQGEFSQLTVTVCGTENETEIDRKRGRERGESWSRPQCKVTARA